MLANTFVFLSAFVGITTVVNFLLSEPQKKAFALVVHKVWNWLDDVKQLSFISWLDDGPSRRNLAIAALMIPLLFAVIALSGDWETALLLLALATITGLVAYVPTRGLVDFLVSVKSPWIVLGKATGVLLIGLMPIWFVMQYLSGRPKPEIGVTWEQINALAIYILPYALTLSVGYLVILFWLVVTFPLIAAYTASGFLHVSEFVLRRLAEYPGPLLGLSVIGGGIVAIFKAIS
jgi:hypothetical protein